MSLQAGIWGFDGNPVNAESLIALTRSVMEYGPDGATSHVSGEIGMLYRALHTTAESRLGKQPFVSGVGNVVTFDGRLDNRNELLRQLRNDEANSGISDVTLVAAAFDRWDCDCFAKLVGDWAIAVWVGGKRQLVLARDYIGIRPLFYHRSSERVTWCSQLEPLASGGGKFTLCEEYIAGYLGGFPDADLTPYREIGSVPPGGYVRIDKSKSTAHLYWTFDPSAKTRYNTDEEYEEHFRHLFRQSIRRRLRADCPILAGLSGGLDSSSIVCAADEIRQSGERSVPTLDTFSFCDRDEPDEDDFSYFTIVEERRGRVGHHAELKGSGDSLPIGHSCFTPVPGFGERLELKAAVSRVLAQGRYRILLSGIGGDEFLGQAFNPHMHLADLLLRLKFKGFARSLMAWSLATRQPWLFLLFDTLALLLPAQIRSAIPPRAKAEPWINPRFARRHRLAARTLQAAEGEWWWSPKARDAYQTYSTISRQLTYFSSSTTETRYPFLDQTLVEFLWSVPATQLARPGAPRSLMRRALKNLLPPEILARRTKASAGRCIVLTLQKHRDKLAGVLRSSASCRRGYTEPGGLERALLATANGQIPFQIVLLLRAVALEFWLREAVACNVISGDL